ncbi:hypothetical protein GW17_00032987 [Ensete ventricosum]|nr:hypothetical protein GW17_00032987 [Ensete ventricosum]RZS09276.1 hypothetical protein BHM03_00040338 [Ensete ventricosum]
MTAVVAPTQATVLRTASGSLANGRHLISGQALCPQVAPLWAPPLYGLLAGERHPLQASCGRPPLLVALAACDRPCTCLAMVGRPCRGLAVAGRPCRGLSRGQSPPFLTAFTAKT